MRCYLQMDEADRNVNVAFTTTFDDQLSNHIDLLAQHTVRKINE